MAVDLDTWAKAAEERLIGAPLERSHAGRVDPSIKFHDLALLDKSALEEIGALAVFLAGEVAASITGVDGGWTAH